MFHGTKIGRLVTGSLAAATVASMAGAQSRPHHPDAAGYPCATKDRLTIVQGPQGFSITRVQAQQESTAPLRSAVPLGARLTLDRALFVEHAATPKEVADAPRR